MSERSVDDLTKEAEARWLETWVEGPSDKRNNLLPFGATAPDFDLLRHTGETVALSSYWSDKPALVMFWRHFGCGCGIDRGARLRDEWDMYFEAGLVPVIVGQGDPERAAVYKEKYEIPCDVLVDESGAAYDAYGLAHFGIEQVLYDAPEEMWGHSMKIGVGFQEARRALGRPLVDDPWRSPGEFVIAPDATIKVSYTYQYCEDFPDPRVFATAARLA